MAFRTQKISQMTPKGADLEATDLIEVSTIESGSYVTRSITGQELIDAIPLPPSGLTVGTTPIASGTIGRVLFQGTGNVLQQSSSLFWDSTNNRLGIGTSTPAFALDIVGSVRALENVNYPQIILGRTTTRYAALTWDDPNSEALFQTFSRAFPFVFDSSLVRFMTNGLERMRVFNSGNVAINTTTDAGFRLDVNGTARVSGNATITGDLTVDTNTFYVDSVNNRVGAGTTTPQRFFEVSTSAAGIAQIFRVTNRASSSPSTGAGIVLLSDDNNPNAEGDRLGLLSFGGRRTAGIVETAAFIQVLAASEGQSVLQTHLDISTNGASGFYTHRFNNLGFFGINNTSPTQTLDVNGTGRIRNGVSLADTSGNVLIGTTTDAGFRLDVNGTARVQNDLSVSRNQNNPTKIAVSNTTAGNNSFVEGGYASDSSSGECKIGKYSSTTSAYKIITASNAYFYNGTIAGDIAILNDFATGQIKFAAGGSSTAHMTIKSNGRINMSALPTSSAGLSAGDVWNDGGTLKIV